MRIISIKKKQKFISLFSFIIILILFTKKKYENFSNLKVTFKEKYTDKIPIFTFHRLVPDEVKKNLYPTYQWVGSINIFEEMIKYLYDNKYKTISTIEFYKWYIGEIEYDKKTVLITIDDGFYEDYYLVYPILKKYDFKATSFVVGSRIQDKISNYDKYTSSFLGMDAINKVREDYPYFEFQSHSYNMHYFVNLTSGKRIGRINTMSYEELENDTLKNEKYHFKTMAYPFGVYNKEIKKILADHGYLISFKFGNLEYATRNSDRFAIPRIKLSGYDTLDSLKKWLKY